MQVEIGYGNGRSRGSLRQKLALVSTALLK